MAFGSEVRPSGICFQLNELIVPLRVLGLKGDAPLGYHSVAFGYLNPKRTWGITLLPSATYTLPKP